MLSKHMTRWKIAAGILAIAAAGCVRNYHVTVAQQNVAAPAHPPVRPPRGTFVVERTALADATTRLNFLYAVNPDCTAREPGAIRVLDPPQHGSAQILTLADYPRFPPSNVMYSPCDKVKVKGIAIEYTPKSGYFGGDYLSYEVIGENGLDRTFKVPLTVK